MNAAHGRRSRHWSGAIVRRLALIVASLAVALLAVNACSSTRGTSSAPAQSGTGAAIASGASGAAGTPSSAASTIHIHDFSYTVPASVPAGAQVEVMNMDGEAHTVTADSGGGFAVRVPAGQTMTFIAPTKPGRYPFHCEYHSNMHGTLIVR